MVKTNTFGLLPTIAVLLNLAAVPAQAEFTNASQCLSQTFSARGFGLSQAHQKWAARVKAAKGGLWSDIHLAADYTKECGTAPNGATGCRVEARPCRPKYTLKKVY